MNESEAKRIAQKYLSENPLNHPDYEWELRKWTETPEAWIFPFCYRCTKDIPPEKQGRFGGAPAFTVSKKDGTVKVVSWAEYQNSK